MNNICHALRIIYIASEYFGLIIWQVCRIYTVNNKLFIMSNALKCMCDFALIEKLCFPHFHSFPGFVICFDTFITKRLIV